VGKREQKSFSQNFCDYLLAAKSIENKGCFQFLFLKVSIGIGIA